MSPEDTPSIFVLNYLYQLPFGEKQKVLNRGGMLNRVVGGWSAAEFNATRAASLWALVRQQAYLDGTTASGST